MGYFRAGFRVEGVDHLPQRNYPFRFYQDDALRYLEKEYRRYDVIHASPPCQAHSNLRNLSGKVYEDIIPQTRELLQWTGKPYVIENVENALLESPIVLCGSMFGLKVYRHRNSVRFGLCKESYGGRMDESARTFSGNSASVHRVYRETAYRLSG